MVFETDVLVSGRDSTGVLHGTAVGPVHWWRQAAAAAGGAQGGTSPAIGQTASRGLRCLMSCFSAHVAPPRPPCIVLPSIPLPTPAHAVEWGEPWYGAKCLYTHHVSPHPVHQAGEAGEGASVREAIALELLAPVALCAAHRMPAMCLPPSPWSTRLHADDVCHAAICRLRLHGLAACSFGMGATSG